MESNVRRVMSHTLSQEVALEYNWVGKGAKKAFEKLRLKKVILGLYFCFFKGDFTGASICYFGFGVIYVDILPVKILYHPST